MILITDVNENKIKVRFPKTQDKPEKIIYYTANDSGFSYSCDSINKNITCPKYQTRVLIYFDILIKKKEYGFSVDDIFYKGQRITGKKTTKFPQLNMHASFTEEEFNKERSFLDNIKSGVLLQKPKNTTEFELLFDLISAKGIR